MSAPDGLDSWHTLPTDRKVIESRIAAVTGTLMYVGRALLRTPAAELGAAETLRWLWSTPSDRPSCQPMPDNGSSPADRWTPRTRT